LTPAPQLIFGLEAGEWVRRLICTFPPVLPNLTRRFSTFFSSPIHVADAACSFEQASLSFLELLHAIAAASGETLPERLMMLHPETCSSTPYLFAVIALSSNTRSGFDRQERNRVDWEQLSFYKRYL